MTNEQMKLLHPVLQDKLKILQGECAASGIFINYSVGFRTVKDQEELYAQGRTKPGNIVTNVRGTTYGSQHQWGIACDFYLDMDIDGDGDKKDDAFNNIEGTFDKVGDIAKSIGLGWGGDWTSFKDRPHLYLPNWGSTTTKLKQIYGRPENFIITWDRNLVFPNTNDIQNEQKEELPWSGSNDYTYHEFVKDVQEAIGAKVDGIAGPETFSKTVTVSRTINKYHPVVTPLERYLKSNGYYVGDIEEDKGEKPIFGWGMEEAVKKYQKDIGFKNPDGEITARNRTWKNLLQYGL